MPRIKVTYEIFDDESVEQGDAKEHGFDDGLEFDGNLDQYDVADELTVVDKAVDFLLNQAYVDEPSSTQFHPGVWYTSYGEHDRDFRTGEWINHSFHPEGYTVEEERQIFERIAAAHLPNP